MADRIQSQSRRLIVVCQTSRLDELTAYQLGHSHAKMVRDLYGHGRADAWNG